MAERRRARLGVNRSLAGWASDAEAPVPPPTDVDPGPPPAPVEPDAPSAPIVVVRQRPALPPSSVPELEARRRRWFLARQNAPADPASESAPPVG